MDRTRPGTPEPSRSDPLSFLCAIPSYFTQVVKGKAGRSPLVPPAFCPCFSRPVPSIHFRSCSATATPSYRHSRPFPAVKVCVKAEALIYADLRCTPFIYPFRAIPWIKRIIVKHLDRCRQAGRRPSIPPHCFPFLVTSCLHCGELIGACTTRLLHEFICAAKWSLCSGYVHHIRYS